MQVSVQQRQQGRNLRMMMMREKEEDLALFLELQKREMDKNNLLLLQNSDDYDGSNNLPARSPISKIVSAVPTNKTGAYDFLNSENDKTDYDWLLTPPGTPLFPSLEMESQKTTMSQMGIPNAHPIASKSRLANSQVEHALRSGVTSRQASVNPVLNSSNAANRRTSQSTGPASTIRRSATPTGRLTLPAATKPSMPSTPTSRTTLPSTTKPTAPALRSSTPTRSTARSSTPTARPSAPASKSTSRSATPTPRSSTPSRLPGVSAPRGRSSSVTKSPPTTSKSSLPSRGNSPIVKSKAWKPSEMPGFSLDAPPNLKTSMPERPASASRGRPGAPSARSSSGEAGSNRRPRQQSCSPSRGRVPHENAYSKGSSIPAMSRVRSNGSDDVNPVLIGTQMVERVINMRKLAPPKKDDHHSTHSNPVGKTSSFPDGLGFGRTLSKKSLDMAMRHMDIRRSVSGNLRSIMTNIPASSMYSVRSGSSKGRTTSVSDSPLATSSNASSEPSVNKNLNSLDGSEMEDDDMGSERGDSSTASQHES